jgi:hypothetical protein
MNNGYCIDGVNVNNIEDYVFSNQAMGIFLDVEVLVAVALFRETTQNDPCLINTLEKTERIISIELGEVGNNQASKLEMNGDNFNITLDKNKSSSYGMSKEIYSRTTEFVNIYAPIINDTTIYDTISMIPFAKFGTIGKSGSIIKGIFDQADTISRYQTGEHNGWVTGLSTAFNILGFFPYASIPCGLATLIMDTTIAQSKFDEQTQKRGVYEFLP